MALPLVALLSGFGDPLLEGGDLVAAESRLLQPEFVEAGAQHGKRRINLVEVGVRGTQCRLVAGDLGFEQ